MTVTVSDLELNKRVAVDLLTTAFTGDLDEAISYLGEPYIQHNPQAADGHEAVRGFFTWLRDEYPNLTFEIKRVIAEGDIVVTHSHLVLEPGTPGRALADIFRLKEGKVAEHWDVMQDVPETAANANGMF